MGLLSQKGKKKDTHDATLNMLFGSPGSREMGATMN